MPRGTDQMKEENPPNHFWYGLTHGLLAVRVWKSTKGEVSLRSMSRLEWGPVGGWMGPGGTQTACRLPALRELWAAGIFFAKRSRRHRNHSPLHWSTWHIMPKCMLTFSYLSGVKQQGRTWITRRLPWVITTQDFVCDFDSRFCSSLVLFNSLTPWTCFLSCSIAFFIRAKWGRDNFWCQNPHVSSQTKKDSNGNHVWTETIVIQSKFDWKKVCIPLEVYFATIWTMLGYRKLNKKNSATFFRFDFSDLLVYFFVTISLSL